MIYEGVLWGVCLRFIQSSLQAAPFVFTGLCVMGLLHRMLGQQHTKWLFGSNTVGSLFQSWVIGMLLPGCSLGTIPIVKQLRRSGIAVGTIFAFALSSPLFDPLSLLYGLTLSKPMTILLFAGFSLVVVTISGALFDRWFPNTEVDMPEPTLAPAGVKRLLSVLVAMAREAVSGTMGLILIGLLGAALLSLFLPPGILQRTMGHDNPASPLLMTGIAIPAYATPMMAMGQLGSMFQHGNSIGAAFILLIFGAGVNLGLIAWMWLNYGSKKCLIWMSLMIFVVLTISYGIERPLYPTEIEPADHTHAFDTYCQPFHVGQAPVIGYPAEIWRRIQLESQSYELVGLAGLLSLVLMGLGLKVLDRYWVIETWLIKQPVQLKPSRWDVTIPAPVLTGLGVVVIVAFSAVGCLAYYPSPEETLEELVLAKTEAFSAATSGDQGHALHWLPICESWNRRLQVGTYLRYFRLSDYHRMKARILRDRLEELEHLVENGEDPDVIRKQVNATDLAFRRMSNAYRTELK
jgi:uncharacterized membrane protein YraQ (UPF0718 family)